MEMSANVKKFAKDVEIYNALKKSVGQWYEKAYPGDADMVEYMDLSVTFGDLADGLASGIHPGEILGVGDSIVRERIFEELSEKMGVDYNDIYEIWTNDGVKISTEQESEIEIEAGNTYGAQGR